MDWGQGRKKLVSVSGPDVSKALLALCGFMRGSSAGSFCFHGPGAKTQLKSGCYLQLDPKSVSVATHLGLCS